MAHFARIVDNIVQGIIVVNNEVITDSDGNEQEQIGIDFCKSLFGEDTEWVQTSYNANFRNKLAAPGDIWDGENFVDPLVIEATAEVVEE